MASEVLDKKIDLIQWLSTLEDSVVIDKLLKFRQKESRDWWDSVSAEEKLSIEKGIQDADNGKLEPHSTARRLYENWLEEMENILPKLPTPPKDAFQKQPKIRL